MTVWIGLALVASGYIAAILTWDNVKVFINDAEIEIRAREDKAKALKNKLTGTL